MSAEHERVARELVERWDVERGAPGKFPSLSKLIAAALASESARADEAGWRRGRTETQYDARMTYIEKSLVPHGIGFVARDYTPLAERPTL